MAMEVTDEMLRKLTQEWVNSEAVPIDKKVL